MKLTFTTLITCGLLVFFSCSRSDNETVMLMEKAEAFLETQPDSALYYLGLIALPENLPEKIYDDYLLLHIQAKDKSRGDISKDTTIFQLKNKYLRSDPEKEAMSSYYIGKVYFAQRNYEMALTNYLDAERLAEGVGTDRLKGLIQSAIGNIFYHQALLDQARERFHKANDYFIKCNSIHNIVSTYNQIGNTFVIKKQADSAFYYYNKSMEIIDNQNDLIHKSNNLVGIAATYRALKEYDKAKRYLYEALSIPTTKEDKAKIYYNLAQTFLSENKRDSFQICIDRSLESLNEIEDKELRYSIYRFTSRAYELDEDYKKAIYYYQLYSKDLDDFYGELRDKSIVKLEKKYNYQIIQNHNQKLQIQRQNLWILITVIGLSTLLIFFYFYRKSVKNENFLLEAEAKIASLQNLSVAANEKDNSVKGVLVKNFHILTKVGLMKNYLNSEEQKQGSKLLKKFNEIVFGGEDLEWEPIYETLNAIHDNVVNKLKEAYPQLDDSEFKICCLSLGGLSNSEVAMLMNYSINTVQMKRTAIRKKLGIDSKGKIKNYIADQFNLKIDHLDK